MSGTRTGAAGTGAPGSRVVKPAQLSWIMRPHASGEPARHVAECSDLAAFAHTRAETSGATGRVRRGVATDTVSDRQPRPRRACRLPGDAGRFGGHAVGVAQLVELLVVVQAVGGSSPLAHPS